MSKTKIWYCTKKKFVSTQKFWRSTKSNLLSTKASLCCTSKCSMSTKKVDVTAKKYFMSAKARRCCAKNILCHKKFNFSGKARHKNMRPFATTYDVHFSRLMDISLKKEATIWKEAHSNSKWWLCFHLFLWQIIFVACTKIIFGYDFTTPIMVGNQ